MYLLNLGRYLVGIGSVKTVLKASSGKSRKSGGDNKPALHITVSRSQDPSNKLRLFPVTIQLISVVCFLCFAGWGIPNVQSMGNRYPAMSLSETNVAREKYLIFSVSVDTGKEFVTGEENSDT